MTESLTNVKKAVYTYSTDIINKRLESCIYELYDRIMNKRLESCICVLYEESFTNV